MKREDEWARVAGRAAAEQACLKRRLHADEAEGRQYVTLLEAAGLDRLRAAAAESKEGIARARTRRMEQAAVEEDEDARDEAGDRALRALHDLRQEARQAKRELEGLMTERARRAQRSLSQTPAQGRNLISNSVLLSVLLLATKM